MPRWDSNPRSQQALGRRPTPQNARPLLNEVPCVIKTKSHCEIKCGLFTAVHYQHASTRPLTAVTQRDGFPQICTHHYNGKQAFLFLRDCECKCNLRRDGLGR
jgi:hypothetical protein